MRTQPGHHQHKEGKQRVHKKLNICPQTEDKVRKQGTSQHFADSTFDAKPQESRSALLMNKASAVEVLCQPGGANNCVVSSQRKAGRG